MDIYLKELADKKKSFRFPSLPEENITLKRQTGYQEYSIIGKGKLNFPSGMSERSIKWSGYFWGAPRKKLKSINRKWMDPNKCIQKLENWQTKGTPLNLIVTDAGINMDVTIQSFTSKPFGGYGDMSYEISFVPYVKLAVYTTKELGISKPKKKRSTRNDSKSNKSNKKKTYKIVPGDTLCGISRKKYHTSSKWRAIYNANKSTIEKAARRHGMGNSDNGNWIFPGTVLKLP